MHIKILDGAPGETRTPNLLIRSQTLYPIELRAQSGGTVFKNAKIIKTSFFDL